jgi:hypothetical protein
MLRAYGATGLRLARSFASLIPTPAYTHIPARRVATQRFMGGLERHIAPERYVQ